MVVRKGFIESEVRAVPLELTGLCQYSNERRAFDQNRCTHNVAPSHLHPHSLLFSLPSLRQNERVHGRFYGPYF